jgi:hypothetical protein
MRLTLVLATVGDGLADELVVLGSLKVSFLSRQLTHSYKWKGLTSQAHSFSRLL